MFRSLQAAGTGQRLGWSRRVEESKQSQSEREPDATPAPDPWIIPLQTLMDRKTSITWLVKDLLQADGSALLLGAAKSGKSTLARQLAATVTQTGNREFVGRRVISDRSGFSGRALIVNLEDSDDTAKHHLLKLGADPLRLYMTTWPQPPVKERLAALDEAIGYCAPDLVVIDTLQAWLQVEDINAYAEVQGALASLCGLARQHNTCLLLLHHARKAGGTGGAEALGSTAIAGATDCILSLKVREDADQTRTIEANGRNSVKLKRTALKLEDGRIVSAGTIGRLNAEELKDRILEEVENADGGEVTESELRERIGGRKQTLLKLLDELVSFRDLERRGTGKRNDARRYSVPGSVPMSRDGN